ncbi:hypothetical protein D3C86_2193300 [compost metagenome]
MLPVPHRNSRPGPYSSNFMEVVQKVCVDQSYFMHVTVANRNYLPGYASKTVIVPVRPSLS